MPVGHIPSVYGGLVTLHRILGDGVLDLLAVLAEPVKVVEGVAPAALFGDDAAAGTHAVRQDIDDDPLRTDSVRVVSVVPGLDARDDHLIRLQDLRNMHVGYIKSVDGGLVLRNLVLDNGVGNLGSIRRVPVAASEAVSPASALVRTVLRHDLAVDPLAVGKKVDGDLFRTDAVQVVLVIPGLKA